MSCLMKKNFVLMAVAAVVLSACAKENAYESAIAPQYTSEGNVLLFATMPQFEDATKAAIAADGAFSWAVDDKIDVVYTKGGSPDQTYTFSCTNASTGAFEYAGEIADGYTVARAYYPSGYDGEPAPQHFASLEAAAKGFQMEATVSGGKLQFAHENAMFVVTVKNLPLFARTVWVNSASVAVTSESGDVVVRIPVIPTADAKLGIGVTDASWDAATHNDLISKTSEKSHAIEASNLYNLTDLEIGPSILIKNNVLDEWSGIGSGCWWDGSIALHTYNASYSTTWSESNLKSVTISGEEYLWFIYPEECDGQEMDVIIHRPGYDYPRLTTKIVPTGEISYTFGFATGLKRPTDKFMHLAFANDKRGYVYAWKLDDDTVKPFGDWKSEDYLQKVRMWDNDSTPRESYIFNVGSYNPTDYGLIVFDPTEVKYWNNQNRYGAVDPGTGWVEEYNVSTAADSNFFIPVTTTGDYYIYMWEDGVNHNWKEGYDTYLTYVYN